MSEASRYRELMLFSPESLIRGDGEEDRVWDDSNVAAHEEG